MNKLNKIPQRGLLLAAMTEDGKRFAFYANGEIKGDLKIKWIHNLLIPTIDYVISRAFNGFCLNCNNKHNTVLIGCGRRKKPARKKSS